jgi:hypothetical protein
MIYICNGINKNGVNCKNKTKNNKLCWRHKKNNKTITEKGNCINVIPNEIYMIIYEYLEFNDKINFSKANKRSYIIFKNSIKNNSVKYLLNKDIKASYYIKNYLENNKLHVFMNLNYNNNYYKGLEEIDFKVTNGKKEIILYKNHIYENNCNKKINFGFETKKLKCIDDKIKLISDLLIKLKYNLFILFDLNKKRSIDRFFK